MKRISYIIVIILNSVYAIAASDCNKYVETYNQEKNTYIQQVTLTLVNLAKRQLKSTHFKNQYIHSTTNKYLLADQNMFANTNFSMRTTIMSATSILSFPNVFIPFLKAAPFFEIINKKASIWFLILMLLLFILFSFYRIKKNYSKKHQLLQEKNAQLQDELARFIFNNNTLKKTQNFIIKDIQDTVGNRLAGISNLCEILTEMDENSERRPEFYNSLRHTALNFNEELNDLFWACNINNNSLDAVIIRLDFFVSKQQKSTSQELIIKIDRDRNYHIPPFWNNNILTIIKEALSNAIIHSQCTRATINISAKDGHLKVTCKDNGKGFNIDNTTSGAGLSKMKEKSESMAWKLKISSEIDKGTEVTINGLV